ncbi:hypothetical protein [Methanosphaera sp.]
MRQKNVLLIIICIIVLCLIGVGAYTLFSTQESYKNITMNGIQIEVPDNNITVVNQTEHYSIYNDTENNLTILTLDSEDTSFADMSELVTYAGTREVYQVGATSQTKDNVTFNKSESTGIYSYVGNYTNKNILISTTDEDLMIHILQSMKLAENSTQNTTDNSTDNSTLNETDTSSTTTTSTAKKSSSNKSSSSSSSSSRKIYGYAGDGTPFYSQQEVDEYNYAMSH